MSAITSYGEFALLSARYRGGQSEAGAERFFELAQSVYYDGNQDLAQRALRRATKLAPGNAMLRTWLGGMEYEQGKLEEARESFGRAMAIDPEAVDAYLGMAISLHASGRPSESIYYYLTYLRVRPGVVSAMSSLAAAYQATGQIEEAIGWFDRACALQPDDPEVQALYGRTLYELGRIEEGRDHLERAIELGSQDSEVHRLLALSLGTIGEPQDAHAELERALVSDPRNVAARIELADSLLQEGKKAEALEHARQAAQIAVEDDRPDDEKATAFWQLGWSEYAVGDYRSSAKASRKALSIDPTLVAVRFNLGLALLHRGKIDDAWREYRQAARETQEAWDLRVTGIEDLKQALRKDPVLPAQEILEFLEERYEELTSRREDPLPA